MKTTNNDCTMIEKNQTKQNNRETNIVHIISRFPAHSTISHWTKPKVKPKNEPKRKLISKRESIKILLSLHAPVGIHFI